MIPVYLKRTKGEEPPAETHYVVARNGLFLHKKMGWVDAVVPMDDMKVLDPEFPSANLLLPKLPAEVLTKALKLSKAVYDISKSEVCMLLHHGEKAGYQLTVPEQTVWPWGIDYEPFVLVPDALCVGTIHSHADFEACHSEIDHDDEQFTDGVHITLGNMAYYPKFSFSAEIVVNGNRFPADEKWFEGLTPEGLLYRINDPSFDAFEVPPEWLRVVTHAEPKKERRKKKL